MANGSSIHEMREFTIHVEPTVGRLRDYYAVLDCRDAQCDPDSIHCALHPFAINSVWRSWKADEQTEKWTIPGRVELDIFLGSGQNRHPYTTRYEEFEARCEKIEFSASILRDLRAMQPLYRYRIHRDKENRPAILELAISVYETDSIFTLVRYDLNTRLFKGLVFVKQADKLSTCPLTFSSLARFLDERRADVAADPMLLIPTLLSFQQFRSHEPARWLDSVLDLEGWLGVTRRRDHLDNMGYPELSDRLAFLNAQEASLALELDETGAAARSIALLFERVGRLARMCAGAERCPSEAEMAAECREVTARLYALQVDMCVANMQTLKGALYNRMSEAENRTMKGIAVIGLVFLPTMLVASVFQAESSIAQSSNSGGNGMGVSKSWLLFLSLSVGLTTLVMGVWALWERYGYRWLDYLKNMEVKQRWQWERQIYSLPYENELRLRQLSKSAQGHRAICTNRQYCIHNTQLSSYRR